MKDPYAVLQQKERDAKRVRKEVDALLTVIPLLTEEDSSSPILQQMTLNANPKTTELDTDMLELERYYPFIKNFRS